MLRRSSAQSNIPGGLFPMDPNSSKIQEITAWAVNKHNENQGTKLVDEKAYKAEGQVVSGTMYYIWLEATNGGLRQKYFAKVYEQVWTNTIELKEFEPLKQENERIAVAN